LWDDVGEKGGIVADQPVYPAVGRRGRHSDGSVR
jgi:hypothetical protein